jgi:hypothetical protein
MSDSTRNSDINFNEFVATVFLSYQHEDIELARALEEGLQEKGFFVWRDEGELRVGDSIINRVSDALDVIDFVVPLVSATSVKSEWCKREISLAMTGELARREVVVLPLRVDATPMPPSLADKFYLAISAKDGREAAELLATSIRKHLLPPRPIPPRWAVRVLGIDVDGVELSEASKQPDSPRYIVPVRLSKVPTQSWANEFQLRWALSGEWDNSTSTGTRGDRILLTNTTVDRVERELEQLEEVVADVNRIEVRRIEAERAKQLRRDSERRLRDVEITDFEARTARVNTLIKSMPRLSDFLDKKDNQ